MICHRYQASVLWGSRFPSRFSGSPCHSSSTWFQMGKDLYQGNPCHRWIENNLEGILESDGEKTPEAKRVKQLRKAQQPATSFLQTNRIMKAKVNKIKQSHNLLNSGGQEIQKVEHQTYSPLTRAVSRARLLPFSALELSDYFFTLFEFIMLVIVLFWLRSRQIVLRLGAFSLSPASSKVRKIRIPFFFFFSSFYCFRALYWMLRIFLFELLLICFIFQLILWRVSCLWEDRVQLSIDGSLSVFYDWTQLRQLKLREVLFSILPCFCSLAFSLLLPISLTFKPASSTTLRQIFLANEHWSSLRPSLTLSLRSFKKQLAWNSSQSLSISQSWTSLRISMDCTGMYSGKWRFLLWGVRSCRAMYSLWDLYRVLYSFEVGGTRCFQEVCWGQAMGGMGDEQGLMVVKDRDLGMLPNRAYENLGYFYQNFLNTQQSSNLRIALRTVTLAKSQSPNTSNSPQTNNPLSPARQCTPTTTSSNSCSPLITLPQTRRIASDSNTSRMCWLVFRG